ncbi:molecular chaperone DnaJ [Gigaspora margarita]|uniref:Molecular chaperone DnaJ n=1 Tax=Gigaspora margarita TaxID=4874 RepID=A0A8H4AB98_GIGMA|nr:molecular chaperone DnaJ [Gigaspora margarita]
MLNHNDSLAQLTTREIATVIGPKELDAQLILNIYSKCLETCRAAMTYYSPKYIFWYDTKSIPEELIRFYLKKKGKKTCIGNSRKDEKVPSGNVSNSPESVKETIRKAASDLEIMLSGRTTTEVKKSNPLAELLARMKREDIVGIRLNESGNLVVEYSGTSYVIMDNNLTDEQKEIKEFLQQCFFKKSK